MKTRRVLVLTLFFAATAACTFNPSGQGPGGGHPGGSGSGTGAGGGSGIVTPCTSLSCRQSTCKMGNCAQPACPAGMVTQLSGKVYDPAGKVPLYNVQVYVPNKPLADLKDGPSCDTCETALSGDPIVQAATDAAGNFTLGGPGGDVPSGANVPLVMQIGEWRRQITIANVTACTNTALTDTTMMRLPRNQGEGHIPKIALTTGSADALECLLRKIGLDDAEFTTESGTGRVNFFNGEGGTNAFDAAHGGAMFTPAPTFWDTLANLNKYDLVLHSCEGTENPTNKSMMARQALLAYANSGGRVFASHWHNYWFEHGPAPLPTIATFNHQADLNNITATIDTSFDKGMALADWLVNVGGSTTRGQLPIMGAQHTVDAAAMFPTAQRWIYLDNPRSVQYLSANTPIDSTAKCGRVVLSDLHVSTGSGGNNNDASSPSKPFPSGCVTTDLSPQEKTLEFMLFDLSSCVSPVVP